MASGMFDRLSLSICIYIEWRRHANTYANPKAISLWDIQIKTSHKSDII